MPGDEEPPQRESIRSRLARFIAGEPVETTPHGSAASQAQMRVRLKDFDSLSVGDVMTSRAEIAAVEVETPLGDVLAMFAAQNHSRMPVYRESLDEPLGFIHVKDMVTEGVRGGWSAEALASRPIAQLMREILYVPQSTRLADLMIDMQARRIHLALVIDEYGGTGGLVSLEDLVEQIVGDIEDEHDELGPRIVRRSKSVWEVDGLADIDVVERETQLPLAVEAFAGEVETFGGLVSALAGRVPAEGEIIAHPRGHLIEVLETEPRRVVRVKLKVQRPGLVALAEGRSAAVDG